MQPVALVAHTCTQLSKASRGNNTHNFSNETVQVSVPPGGLSVHEARGGVTHHVVGLLQAGFVASRRHTVVSMPITQATAFHNKIIDGVMFRGERGGARLLHLTRTRLTLQETDSQVGDHQLVLGSRSERIHLVRGRQSSVDHLEIGVKVTLTNLFFSPSWSRQNGKKGIWLAHQAPERCCSASYICSLFTINVSPLPQEESWQSPDHWSSFTVSDNISGLSCSATKTLIMKGEGLPHAAIMRSVKVI